MRLSVVGSEMGIRERGSQMDEVEKDKPGRRLQIGGGRGGCWALAGKWAWTRRRNPAPAVYLSAVLIVRRFLSHQRYVRHLENAQGAIH